MFESPLYGKRRSLVEVAFLSLWLAGQPVLADPVTESSETDSSNPSIPVQLSSEDIDTAVALRCPGEAYRVLVLGDGRAFLQINPEHPDQLQELAISDALNPTKTTIDCGEASFEIRTSPPFSNKLVEQHFELEKGEARFASKREYDPTEQLLEEATQLVFSGNRDALNALDFSGIEFAYQYVNAERIHRLMNQSMKRCDRQPCKPLIENTFLLITRLSTAISGTERDPSLPAQWILALDDLAVPVADSAPLLLRYTEILKRMNQREDAIAIVEELVRRDTESPDMRLFYGDLLWESGQKEEARVQYRAFAELIARDGKTPPTRIARLLAD